MKYSITSSQPSWVVKKAFLARSFQRGYLPYVPNTSTQPRQKCVATHQKALSKSKVRSSVLHAFLVSCCTSCTGRRCAFGCCGTWLGTVSSAFLHGTSAVASTVAARCLWTLSANQAPSPDLLASRCRLPGYLQVTVKPIWRTGNSNSKNLFLLIYHHDTNFLIFYKDCSLGSVKIWANN